MLDTNMDTFKSLLEMSDDNDFQIQKRCSADLCFIISLIHYFITFFERVGGKYGYLYTKKEGFH